MYLNAFMKTELDLKLKKMSKYDFIFCYNETVKMYKVSNPIMSGNNLKS